MQPSLNYIRRDCVLQRSAIQDSLPLQSNISPLSLASPLSQSTFFEFFSSFFHHVRNFQVPSSSRKVLLMLVVAHQKSSTVDKQIKSRVDSLSTGSTSSRGLSPCKKPHDVISHCALLQQKMLFIFSSSPAFLLLKIVSHYPFFNESKWNSPARVHSHFVSWCHPPPQPLVFFIPFLFLLRLFKHFLPCERGIRSQTNRSLHPLLSFFLWFHS